MKKITHLTDDQKARMPEWRDKWIEIGLRTGETDWDTFEKYIKICYEKAGIPFPNKIIRVQSPLVGAFASSIANKVIRGTVDDAVSDAVSGAVRDAVDDAVSDAVDDAVYDAVRDAIGNAIGGAVDNAVDDAVRDAVDDAVSGAVSGAVRDAVDDAVSDAVDDAVYDAVRDAIGNAVDDAVYDAVYDAVGGGKLSWHYWLGGQFWVGWWNGTASVSYFTDVCELELSKDMKERAEAYRKICESVNYIWLNSNFVMVCARPTKILRNSRGQLHNPKGKAIEYPDGWGLYMLNGVRFEEKLFKKITSGEMPFQDILAISDIDQRTQAMRFADVDNFITHAKGVLLDEHNKFDIEANPVNYKLYKFPKGDIFTEDAYYMLFDCPSTRKKHMEGVNPATTVAEAMAWAESDDTTTMTQHEWKRRVPLVDEV